VGPLSLGDLSNNSAREERLEEEYLKAKLLTAQQRPNNKARKIEVLGFLVTKEAHSSRRWI
jgi:hypothetical protein